MKRKALGYIFLISGIILISVTLSLKIYYEHKQKLLRNQFEESFIELNVLDKSASDIEINNLEDSEENNGSKSMEQDKKVFSNKAIAILNIPKINLKVAVVEGINSKDLKYAVGHFSNTSNVGKKGNFAIAGHNSYAYGEYFNRLDEIDKGDIIIIENQISKYKYIIYDKFIVEPNEIWVLNETKNSTITLVTCTIDGKKRLILKGILE